MSNSSVKQVELWQSMIDSMMEFTEVSTFLIDNMQDRLGEKVNSQVSKKMLEHLKSQVYECKPVSTCKCSYPEEENDDKSLSDEDISLPLVVCHQPPRIIKKKKFVYHPDVESTIKAKKKKESACKCCGNTEILVDSCLCEKEINSIENDACQKACITICSPLKTTVVENLNCSEERSKLKNKELDDGINRKQDDSSLAGIKKPGAYNPDELPQDDNHEYVLKACRDLKAAKHGSIGYELFLALKEHGDKIAQINHKTGEIRSYSQLYDKCISVAINLKKETTKSDIIGLCCGYHYIPYIAALFNGNRVVAYDRFCNVDKLAHCFESVTPKIMFACAESGEDIKKSMQLAGVNFKIVLFGSKDMVLVFDYIAFETYLEADEEEKKKFNVKDSKKLNATALICFLETDFSDKPKAVCLSHSGILKQNSDLISHGFFPNLLIDLQEISKLLAVHVLIGSIISGSTRIIVDPFKPNQIWKIIEEYKVNSIYMFPHQCIELRKNFPEANEDVSSLRIIFTGGEKINPAIIHKIQDTLVGTLVCQIFEHTELSGITTCFNLSKPYQKSLMSFKPESCGKQFGDIWYKVIDLNTGLLVGHSTPGELYVKSKTVRNGYFVNNNEEEVANKDEWCRTGDLVMYDYYGYFYYLGKITDLIRINKKFVYPYKLEKILMDHPAVECAAVVGVTHKPSEKSNRKVLYAFVTLNEKNQISEENLKTYVNDQVSRNEKLFELKILDRMPFTNSGKINRIILSKCSCIK